jgi:hypothetical protein
MPAGVDKLDFKVELTTFYQEWTSLILKWNGLHFINIKSYSNLFIYTPRMNDNTYFTFSDK